MSAAVLVVLDPDLKASQPAFDKGRALANATGAALEVAVNGYSAAMVRAVGFDKSRLEAATAQIQHAWQQRIDTLAGDLPCKSHILWQKHEIDALKEVILTRSPDLVVVHTSAESGLRRHLFTPRDWQLIRKAPCNVMCVHGHPWSSPANLLLAVDPDSGQAHADALSVAITQQAVSLADNLAGRLHISHVMDAIDDSLVLLMGEAMTEFSGSLEDIRDSQKQAFKRFASGQGIAAEQLILLEGPVAPTLSEYCENNDVDLLIVGTVHRNLPERLLLGATAEAVINRASCDVLVVKPDDFQTPWKP